MKRTYGLVLLLLCLTASAQTDWREAFAEGVRARDMGQWREVVRWMERAIESRPDATGEKIRIYGMKWERYIPYYYLGMARYKLGDCPGVLKAFESAHRYGAVGLVAQSRMEPRLTECARRTGTPPGAPRLPTGQSSGAGGSASSPRSAPSQGSKPYSATPQQARQEALAQEVEETRAAVRQAQDRLRRVDAQLERTRRRAFVKDPRLEARYEAATRGLEGARHALEAGRREKDLNAVVRAGSDAYAAAAELEELARLLGIDR